ncbi:MAG: hypothetical protein JSW46_05170 [Gemmatimonadota bacterium]|nr:MAG: hypothetical protein JSW46_05170 [Gemmatimonadota bacterium]
MLPGFGPSIQSTVRQSELQLDADRIVETVDALERRIRERFPDSGLGKIASQLNTISHGTVERLRRAAEPILPLRIAAGLGIVALLVLLIELIVRAQFPSGGPNFFELVEALEAGGNILIFVGLLVLFLVTLEGRIKRRRALHALRDLRALAHIVDMHQLNKDPDKVLQPVGDTPSSPPREYSQALTARYLDYCSELLSLVSKVAALYAQTFDDPVVLSAVEEVETLTTALSGKIWQKIMILDRTVTPAQ